MSEVVFYSDIIEACNHTNFPKRNFPEGVELIMHFKGSDRIPTFKVMNYEDDVIVWFRGTQVSTNDITMDVIFQDEPFLDGRCHSGYLNAARDALMLLEPYIQSARNIITCGHSLGAACASIVACILRFERKMENVRCFNLACPGIFSSDIADATRNFITTFCRRWDPIPRIFNMKSLYYHFLDENTKQAINVPGRIIILDSDKDKKPFARKPEDQDFELEKNFVAHLSEHSQRSYLKDLLEIYGEFGEKEQKIVKQKPQRVFAIKKNRGTAIGIASGILVASTCVVTGPIVIGAGSVFGCGIALWYKMMRNKAKIECGEAEDFSDEYSESI